MMATMPALFSLRVKYAAMIKMIMVTGMAAMVSPNSGSLGFGRTMTTNWTVKPRKKKKSNFRRAI